MQNTVMAKAFADAEETLITEVMGDHSPLEVNVDVLFEGFEKDLKNKARWFKGQVTMAQKAKAEEARRLAEEKAAEEAARRHEIFLNFAVKEFTEEFLKSKNRLDETHRQILDGIDPYAVEVPEAYRHIMVLVRKQREGVRDHLIATAAAHYKLEPAIFIEAAQKAVKPNRNNRGKSRK